MKKIDWTNVVLKQLFTDIVVNNKTFGSVAAELGLCAAHTTNVYERIVWELHTYWKKNNPDTKPWFGPYIPKLKQIRLDKDQYVMLLEQRYPTPTEEEIYQRNNMSLLDKKCALECILNGWYSDNQLVTRLNKPIEVILGGLCEFTLMLAMANPEHGYKVNTQLRPYQLFRHRSYWLIALNNLKVQGLK